MPDRVQREGGVARLNWRIPMVLTWAGTRGVMPLAAALSIPEARAAALTMAELPADNP